MHTASEHIIAVPNFGPSSLRTREWMFIPFGGAPPIRHKGFTDMNSLRQFITERSMHSCFYSTAYWERPFELKCPIRITVDLIFDLDGDHLPGVTDRDFPGMLRVIQEQVGHFGMIFEPEFGFDEKYLQVTFSAIEVFTFITGTAFHLDSEARREMVSFIRGEGVDVKGGFPHHDLNSEGWTRRIRDGMKA